MELIARCAYQQIADWPMQQMSVLQLSGHSDEDDLSTLAHEALGFSDQADGVGSKPDVTSAVCGDVAARADDRQHGLAVDDSAQKQRRRRQASEPDILMGSLCFESKARDSDIRCYDRSRPTADFRKLRTRRDRDTLSAGALSKSISLITARADSWAAG
jgi:hypothetical protein